MLKNITKIYTASHMERLYFNTAYYFHINLQSLYASYLQSNSVTITFLLFELVCSYKPNQHSSWDLTLDVTSANDCLLMGSFFWGFLTNSNYKSEHFQVQRKYKRPAFKLRLLGLSPLLLCVAYNPAPHPKGVGDHGTPKCPDLYSP